MLSNATGKKVTCSYRNSTQTWIGVVIEPDTSKIWREWSEAEYCEIARLTPVQYPFGKMMDSDASLTIIEVAE